MLIPLLKLLRPDILLTHSHRLTVDVAATFAYLWWLCRCSERAFGILNARGRIEQFRFVLLGMVHFRALTPFFRAPADAALGRAVLHRPRMMATLLHPYRSTAWDIPTRLNKLRSHFEQLGELCTHDLLDPDAAIEIIPLTVIEPDLHLVLDQPPWFGAEGPLVLNLFVGDERIYSLAFGLQKEKGRMIAHVGGLQGRALPEINGLYRRLTKAANGLRPRDLLLELFKAYCVGNRLTRILLVSDSHRQHRDAYFGTAAAAVSANYDVIWTEHGADRIDAETFELPLAASRREPASIAVRKRALYQRRYAMMDILQASVIARVGELRAATESRSVELSVL